MKPKIWANSRYGSLIDGSLSFPCIVVTKLIFLLKRNPLNFEAGPKASQ